MFNNISKMMFLMILVSGTFITVSSTSWFSSWMGLEINLLSFIPLMNNKNNLMSSETALKYFLTQAMASSIFFVAIIMSMMKFNNLPEQYLNTNILISIPLLIKMGAAPFHFWFPSIMDGISWINALMLMTWQKIAPMILIFYNFCYDFMIITIITSAVIGGIGGLSQTSIRKLMAFSSINHLSWMMLAMNNSMKTWMIYFIIYTFMSFAVIYLLNQYKMFHINQLFIMFSSSITIKFFFFINFLSLGGLPPFLGFFPKWMVIQQLTSLNQMMLIFMLILCSLITLYFYLRMCYTAFMLGNKEINWNLLMHKNKKNYLFMSVMSFFSISGLPMITMAYLYI